MSSLSAAEPLPTRTRIADGAAARLLAVVCLCGFAFFAQADALSNTLSGPSPVTLLSVLIAAIPAATLLVLLAPVVERPRATGGDGARLVLMLVAWAVFCWTLSDHKSEGLSYLIKFATALGPALCLLIVADRPWHLHAVAWSMIAAGILSALIVLVEHKTGTRILSTAPAAVTADFDGVARSAGASDQNPTTAAQCLMTGAALALGLLFSGEKRWRIVLLGAVAVGAVALVFMSARSAILGFGAGGGIALLSLRRHKAFPLILVAAGIVGVVGLWFAPPTLWERFAAIGDFGKDQTLFRRITYLRIGADLIGQSPVWGIGPGNFPQHYMLYEYRYMPGRILFPRELHNTYLDTATEYGLVGFAIFALLLTHCVLALRRAMAGSDELRRIAFAVLVALVALLVACFFMPHKDLRYLWLILAMAIQCGRLRAGEARA
jgi:O-antigen ligase